MVNTMHDIKVATKDAGKQGWNDGCLVISELDAKTIWIYDVGMVKCPKLKKAALIANEVIEKLTESVKYR